MAVVSNIWHLFNLRESPFFQDPLDPAEGGHYPIELFVGRKDEADYILRGLGGSLNTRHAIQGPPGVGKTTLVQYIKATVARDGWLAEAAPIAVTSAATSEDLLLKILASVHDILAAYDETLVNLEPMRDVRQLLDLERARSLSASFARLGGGMAEVRFTGPGAMATRPATLLRTLSAIASDRLQVPGILIHLNNLENISDADRHRAARIVRDLRDTGLMFHGLHYLLAGTSDAIQAIVASQEQLRSVFSNPGALVPISPSEFRELLNLRYRHLSLHPAVGVKAPVTEEAVETVYGLFRGNLRGTLHALEEAGKLLIGRGENATAPMDLDRMGPVLGASYRSKMQADLNQTQVQQLAVIASRGVDAQVTQAEINKDLKLSTGAISTLFGEFQRKGYLIEVPYELTGRPGRPSQQYALTGASRLAFGALGNA